MQVKHGLSGSGPHVQHGAVSVFNIALAGDLSGGEVAAADQFRVFRFRFLQSREMFPGNDEHMSRSLRLNVFKREDVVVFVNFLGGNLSAKNAAEKTAGGWIGHGCAENSIGQGVGKRPCWNRLRIRLVLTKLRDQVGKWS